MASKTLKPKGKTKKNDGRGESAEWEQNKAGRGYDAPPLSNERPSEFPAPVSSVENAAPKSFLDWAESQGFLHKKPAVLIEMYYRYCGELAEPPADGTAASSPVPKLVEALRQSLDIVHAALQLSGLREIPATVTRARWLKVYESLSSLVRIEEDAKRELDYSLPTTINAAT